MKFALETEDLRVYYGDNMVIKGVDLKVPRNTVFAVMGPSGCGKSTMLRAFNRLLELNEEARVEGKVKIFGRDVYNPEVDPIEVRREVGMVFQYPNPFPHLTIYDNVAIGLKLNGLVRSKGEIDERVEWALKKAALWDEVKNRLNDYPSNLSGGQRQRLVLARALAMKPKILLMDEPTANIDPVGTKKIEELLFELKNEYTIILVTHSPAQAARVSDYVAFIYIGELVEVGPTRKVFENPEHELTEQYVTGVLG
ncbi:MULTISPECIES: phosphate ABC transporter ATP-binding protein [Thermococcus]|uniref:Phosphate import ATP-binding protein pstB n=2 Tax=Thermococcus sibiricus TaxID=172049 RepID=C5ZZU4_THESM|nr:MULTISPECIES: phosphate ABC transporter ATP-binding protein [Thermococcus]KUK29144.1 MAG: Phosphate import ATP-binding protein pstB [Thermococcus sp. 40_45]HII66963.1 phosphate ABC transporter ATP-binding protein [Thermococcaceae archaeon]ACS90925.1 Phosphate import ATP-binding protein pstB [Thermococcus sibiricus MM 739]KUK18503.1 MAG: Phosphate import ATP-binding protein pstB [Thermococcus sibiricus]MBC7094057.1 phosphate ABC transporter ATP-binding protein [Thermococcus sp.]